MFKNQNNLLREFLNTLKPHNRQKKTISVNLGKNFKNRRLSRLRSFSPQSNPVQLVLFGNSIQRKTRKKINLNKIHQSYWDIGAFED